MGYHKRKITRGQLGDFSKIQEEWEELLDAREQKAKILEICEFADLYGAIELYLQNKFGITMDDIKQMANLTKNAFKDGSRK
jgi:phosphoribosyl-ATP pyrophosphohydrolase